MNPLEQFATKFKKVFPDCNIDLAYEEDNHVYYHNVQMDRISHSEESAFEHICTELKEAGYDFWMVYIGE